MVHLRSCASSYVIREGTARTGVGRRGLTRANCILSVQLTSSRVRLGQSFKTVGYGSASCWGDLGAGSVEADVFYIPFIVSVQYIGY